MLGTDRPSVTLAAGGLQKKRIIEYTHGAVKVLNRKKLEGTACECYSAIQQFNGEAMLDAGAAGSRERRARAEVCAESLPQRLRAAKKN